MKKNLLTTGEFASLCRTQKSTLLFYEKEGLLKPKYVSENRYRQYGIEQFFEFDMLTMLKDVGSSLKEIKEHLHNMNGENFLSFLQEKQLAADEELRRVAQRKLMLKDMTTCLREALSIEYDTLAIQQHNTEQLEMTPSGASPSETQWELVQRFAEFNRTNAQMEVKPRYPFGIVYCMDDIQRGDYVDRYYFTSARHATLPERVHTKHEGRYAVLAHIGTDDSHRQTLASMVKKIRAAGMAIKSDAYAYDMMSYIMQDNGDYYALKYAIRVE